MNGAALILAACMAFFGISAAKAETVPLRIQGTISPAVFIPVAEDTGIIHDLGDWVFRQVIRQARRWRAQQLESKLPAGVSSD